MKLKETTSLSDSEHLNFLENDENNPSKIAQINLSDMRTPFKDTEMSVLSLGSPRPSVTDPANHDKIYYDDRFNGTGFDPFLARSSLPKIMISIGGMLLTSFFLNIIITWTVFTNVPELFVLVPVIYNLRGILEQGLTSRLSKASQIGVMQSISGRKKIWLGNLNLVMFQSITAGLFAGLMSCLLSWLSESDGLQVWRSILMIVVAAATTASASIISGFFLFLVLQFLNWAKLNPNDLLGPLTSSFGGFMSLFVLAIYAGFFYLWMGSWFGIVAVVCLLFVANFNFYSKAQKNEAVGTLTSEGWPPMLFSLLITGLSGLLLQRFISEYQSVFALFLPVFTGITGTFAGIYCSEAMTNLHLFQLNPMLPRKTALTLLILSIPVQLILILLIGYVNSVQVSISFTFILSYLIAQSVQVLLLMALADLLIKLSWKFSIKPEANVPALMSTLSDFLGTLVLVAVFYVLKQTGHLGIPPSKIVENISEHAREVTGLLTETVKEVLTDTVKDIATDIANAVVTATMTPTA